MSNLTDFINSELYPRLFEVADRAFPLMGFQPYRGGWASPCKLDGSPSHDGRKDKSVITTIKPNRVLEQGGDSETLIDFYMRHNPSLSFIEAVRELCNICGLTLPPMGGEAQYKAYKDKQEKLERIASKMAEALYTDEGVGTLSYLRNSRGYSDEFIKRAGFGFVSPSLRAELRELFKYTDQSGKEQNRLPYDVGISYFLAIPYRTGGNIQGFVFRTTTTGATPKYKDAFISATASKKYHLFGLTGVNLTGNRERDRDITIVEGEIDALRAIFEGLPNVVAASGGEVSAEAISEALRRGVKRVTLLYDTGEDGTDKKIERAIATINEAGLTPFVASFPSDGGKVDTDSYLKDHSGDELREIVETALPASLWKSNRLIREATEGKSEGLTQKELHELRGKIINLANSPYTTPIYRDIILRDFNRATGDYITLSALLEEADKEKAAQDELLQRQETIFLAADFTRLANGGQTAEALKLIEDRVKDLKQISKEAEYSDLLKLPTTEAIKSSFKQRPTGVATPYSFSGREGREQLILPSGALTYICAPTSHGKSRFLENLALSLANNGEAGDVLYFSFEEDSVAIQEQLLNIHANMTLSQNNSRSLRAYLREGTTQYFTQGVSVAALQAKEAELYDLLTSGKLRVYYRDYDSSDLMDAIRYIAKHSRVKAVFVDYIQLLHTKGTRLQRREELGEMCKDLWRLAIEISTPIVLAAQLNREAYSPLDMTSQNIAEAADIERSANTIILLWNSSFKPTPQKSSYYRSNKGEPTLTDEAKRLQDRGFDIGTGGKIYAKITKNRGGSPNMDAILDFNGNTGRIRPNYTQADTGTNDNLGGSPY